MLDSAKLAYAAIGGSHGGNELITGLLQEVNTYNAIVSPVNPKPKSDQLMRICQVAGFYCTSKPPQPPKPGKPGGGKNALRWAACKDILEQVGKEVTALGLRMLSGPADFKIVGNPIKGLAAADPAQKKQSYWLELIDPEHRPGFQLAPKFDAWLKDANHIATKTSFWDAIGTKDFWFMDHTDQVVKYYVELVGQSNKYGDDRGMLHWVGAQLYDQDDVAWDTTHTETHFSGKGWGIFVVSPEGKIYGGTHKAGKHHHSSFLGGGMVMAAGEIVCYGGIPRMITAKSGHYAPTPENLRNFVNRFLQIPGGCLIQPKVTPVPVFYTVQDFRANGLKATALTKAQLAPWQMANPTALSPEFKVFWDKVL
ncbi:MAG: hypothetical protein ABIR33_10405 [Pyrinomonadaceae bacterium]